MGAGFIGQELFMRHHLLLLFASILACLPIAAVADSHAETGSAPTVLVTGGNRGLGLEFVPAVRRQWLAGYRHRTSP